MSKTIATLVGCAIGDALGNPFEMKSAISPSLTSWDGLFKAGGTFWKGEPGQYTDDTLMSIALAKSLIQCGKFDPEDVANEYLEWYKTGNTRGIGSTTAGSIVNLKLGLPWTDSGSLFQMDGTPTGGNGTAMRASPIGLFYRNEPEMLMISAVKDATITHNSHEPKMGSVSVALATALFANGNTDTMEVLEAVTEIISDSEVKERLIMAMDNLKNGVEPVMALAEIGTSGYVVHTVGAAFYCLGATDNFKDAVVMAVRAGGDTDTTAAIVGALAGTLYGLEEIPNEYKDTVENCELLQDLTNELINNDI